METISAKPFAEAAEEWLQTRRHRLKPTTAAGYEQHLKKLDGFFGRIPLNQINVAHLREYQISRCQTAGPSYVNHELNTVSQVLSYAGLWAKLASEYEPLPLPKVKVGKCLEDSDLERLYKISQTKKRWQVAYWCTVLTANTTAGPGEIRHLKLGDIHLSDPEYPYIHIRDGLKNDYRDRCIPLNPLAKQAVSELLERAHRLGAHLPEHFLLPARAKRLGELPDPETPMGTWRRAFERMREAAGLPQLRRYDLRHHAITVLLENPEVSEETIEDIAGHVSVAMKKRYSHIRKSAKKAAIMALYANTDLCRTG